MNGADFTRSGLMHHAAFIARHDIDPLRPQLIKHIAVHLRVVSLAMHFLALNRVFVLRLRHLRVVVFPEIFASAENACFRSIRRLKVFLAFIAAVRCSFVFQQLDTKRHLFSFLANRLLFRFLVVCVGHLLFVGVLRQFVFVQHTNPSDDAQVFHLDTLQIDDTH